MLLREKIIVLKNQIFSESDLIVKGLNQKGSQLSFIAKGALKSKKRFRGGVLEPSSYIELEFRFSKSSLHYIQQAWFLDDFSKLRTNWQRLNLALYFLSIMEKISQEGEEDCRELFNLLGNSLKQTEISSDLDKLKIYFQTKVLFLQGVLSEKILLPEILNNAIEKHESLLLSSLKKTKLLQNLTQSLNHYLEIP
ncbi:MAG: DNA repair protein RecO [Bdellovibrionales bacterium]|nr:DNA repair protein RecO [Bdellovibrionales bacterium]